MNLPEGRLSGVEDWPAPTDVIKGLLYRGLRCVPGGLLKPGPLGVAHGFQHRRSRYFRQIPVVQGTDAPRPLGIVMGEVTAILCSVLPEKLARPSGDVMASISTASGSSVIFGISNPFGFKSEG
jgi:hypothetical protein